jgi:hypothetical protein
MSRMIYLHMASNGMIKLLKVTAEGKSKDKHMSKKEHIRYNLKRYTDEY